MCWQRAWGTGCGGAGARRALGTAGSGGGSPNLPFLIHAPGAFLGGVLLPTLGPPEPYGVGLIRFSIDGEIPLLARGFYGALSIAAMVALVAILWRWWRKLPNGTLVFPGTILWFAWRSLQNYFSFAGVFAMAGPPPTLPPGSPTRALPAPSPPRARPQTEPSSARASTALGRWRR